jgi:hypothetical protein
MPGLNSFLSHAAIGSVTDVRSGTLTEIKDHERVWFATGSEIIDAYQKVV